MIERPAWQAVAPSRLRTARLLIPAGATLVAFLALVAGTVFVGVRYIDERSLARERELLTAAFDLKLASLEAIVDENAHWDDAALALRREAPDMDFARRAWLSQTGAGTAYSGAFVSDAAGWRLIGFSRGRELPASRARDAAPLLRLVRSRLDTDAGSASGLVRHNGRPLLLAIAPIRPVTPGLLPAGAPVRSLALTLRLDAAKIARINRSLALQGLRPGAPRAGEASLVLRDAAGQPVETLSWTPARPGLGALRHLAWPALAGLVLIVALSVVMGRSSVDAARRLSFAAMHDPLSGLPNRRAFRIAVMGALAQGREAAIAIIDLDGFKTVNDYYGHAVGDRLVAEVALLLQASARDKAFVARLGGDEFAIAATGSGAEAQLEEVVRAFMEALRQPVRIGDRVLMAGASLGLAAGRPSQRDMGELLRRADMALYEAKAAGRGRFRWYDPVLDERQAADQRLMREMRDALGTPAFRLVYQPIVRSHDGAIAGVEALLRFTSPTRGAVPPSEFIPVAERAGLIGPIGLFVIEQACRDAAAWPGISVAVNISAAQLTDPHLPDSVAAILAQTGFDAARLELEVTETHLIANPARAAEVAERLRALGISLSLDDFGTGFASIGFLRQFRFDKLKIDRSLVCEATDSAQSRALVRSSVAVARALDMVVVAEGVETAGQADAMRSLGCRLMQGWHFARAMEADAFGARLSAQAEAAA